MAAAEGADARGAAGGKSVAVTAGTGDCVVAGWRELQLRAVDLTGPPRGYHDDGER